MADRAKHIGIKHDMSCITSSSMLLAVIQHGHRTLLDYRQDLLGASIKVLAQSVSGRHIAFMSGEFLEYSTLRMAVKAS